MLDLKHILKDKVVIVCLGNIDRGDDGAGPYLAKMIKGKVPYEVIDAGTAPENFTGVIKKLNPDTILIVDAIYFDAEPGEVRLFSGKELHLGEISTHNASPKLLIDYLKSFIEAEIYMIGIRPKSNQLGQGLSREVLKTLRELESVFYIE